jgi:hypothetical protein
LNDCSKKRSVTVESIKFLESSCFIIGDSKGLSEEQKSICDVLLHIDLPLIELQHLIKYDSKIALCLQRFAICANFTERGRELGKEKHLVGEKLYRKKLICKMNRNRDNLIRNEPNDLNEVIELTDLFRILDT